MAFPLTLTCSRWEGLGPRTPGFDTALMALFSGALFINTYNRGVRLNRCNDAAHEADCRD